MVVPRWNDVLIALVVTDFPDRFFIIVHQHILSHILYKDAHSLAHYRPSLSRATVYRRIAVGQQMIRDPLRKPPVTVPR